MPGRQGIGAGGPDMSHDAGEVALAPLRPGAWMCLPAMAMALVATGLLLPAANPVPMPAWRALPFAIALLLAIPALALRRRRVTIQGEALVVAATFYTKRVPLQALDLDQARVVDLAGHVDLSPWLGGNNLHLPGFRAGYVLLRNRRRAFCLLTARDRVLVLPGRDGRLLMLSPLRPHELLARLRRIAAAAAHG